MQKSEVPRLKKRVETSSVFFFLIAITTVVVIMKKRTSRLAIEKRLISMTMSQSFDIQSCNGDLPL